MKNDNQMARNLVNYIEQNTTSLLKQYNDFCLKFEEKNSENNEGIIREGFIFTLKNQYISKESEIIYLQALINTYIENKGNNLNILAEYFDIEDQIINNFMDNGLTGIRNNMAKYTRVLKVEEKKNKDLVEKQELMKKQIETLKNPNKENININNNKIISSNQTTIPTAKSVTNSPDMAVINSSSKSDKKKIKKINEKKELLLRLENEFQDNLKAINTVEYEINHINKENDVIYNEMNKLNVNLSQKLSLIYSLEMKIENNKIKSEKKKNKDI